MNFEKNILITGGAGFIGNHVVRLFVNKYPSYRIINLDALTYAGNLENLRDVEDKANYVFEKANILEPNDLVGPSTGRVAAAAACPPRTRR